MSTHRLSVLEKAWIAKVQTPLVETVAANGPIPDLSEPGLTGATGPTGPASMVQTYVAKTANYTVTAADYTINCNGTFTVTLRTAVGIEGQIFVIKNSGAGSITMATTSSQTIDGAAPAIIVSSRGPALRVQSTGSNWIVI